MEAVPRLPMISFELLTTTEKVQFGPKLKPYIASFYQEDPESYSNEIHNLECLRASAVWPSIDINNCQIMKKYYCQLHFLKSRFPMQDGQAASVYFSWKDDYTKLSSSIADIGFELMCVLINIGAIHTKLGSEDLRNTADGMKMSCTHFQCAAWAFQIAREVYGPLVSFIMVSSEQIRGMQMVCLAQAQECILEKSLLDNRKATIIAKIAVQLVSYYRQALMAFYSGDEGLVIDHLPNHKYILQYLQFKISYHKCIALLYQGQQAEEQQKMGERVAYYNAALEALEDARKQMQKMASSSQGPYKDTLAFTLDVVEGKRKAATNENEFIYHEDVPEVDILPEIKGASLVKGIPFNIHDPEVSGQDIFNRLVPMEAHEASSLYSEQKAQMLRETGERVEKRDQDLNEFMSSMQLDVLSQMKSPQGISQDLVDRAAAMVARPNVNRELVEVMNKLSNSYQEVEAMLNEVKRVLDEENEAEKEYQNLMGKRPPSIVATDLAREASKYQEAHNKASESNQNLHKAMMTHAANIKILAQPLSQLKKQIPTLQLPDANIDDAIVEQMNNLLAKVDQMKSQRLTLWNQLREAVHKDDITGALVTKHPDQTLEDVFKKELEKHKPTKDLIEQNLLAQDNICKALIEAYAKFTPTRKYLQDFFNKRNTTVSALIASHDTYDDLLAKANKGIEFYAKLETNTSKLLQRVKGACKVQQEEREQILLKNGHVLNVKTEVVETTDVANQNKPKLKDYLDSMKDKKNADAHSVYPKTNEVDVKFPVNDTERKNSQDYVPSQSGYTNNYNSITNSSNYGSYGYTQVNYSDKNMDQALAERMNALKIPAGGYQYEAVASQAYNYPVNLPHTTVYSFGPTNLHTAVSPQQNVANYSNPPSSYQTVSSTNYPYITSSEQFGNVAEGSTGYQASVGEGGSAYNAGYHSTITQGGSNTRISQGASTSDGGYGSSIAQGGSGSGAYMQNVDQAAGVNSGGYNSVGQAAGVSSGGYNNVGQAAGVSSGGYNNVGQGGYNINSGQNNNANPGMYNSQDPGAYASSVPGNTYATTTATYSQPSTSAYTPGNYGQIDYYNQSGFQGYPYAYGYNKTSDFGESNNAQYFPNVPPGASYTQPNLFSQTSTTYTQPNSNLTGVRNSTYTQPIVNQAAGSYAQPNLTSTQSSTIYTQPNPSYTVANPIYTQSSATFSQPNIPYTQTNVSYTNTAAYTQPNPTYTQPNTMYTQPSQPNANFVQPNINYTQNPTQATQANPIYTEASTIYTGTNPMLQTNPGYVNMGTYYESNQSVSNYPTADLDKSKFYQDNTYLNNYTTNQGYPTVDGYAASSNYPMQMANQTNNAFSGQTNASFQAGYQATLNNQANPAYSTSTNQINAGYPSTNQISSPYTATSNQSNVPYTGCVNETAAYPNTVNPMNAGYPVSANQTFPTNSTYPQTNPAYPSATPNVYNSQQTPSLNPIPPVNTESGSKKESSIDLLAGLDFSISQAPLIPQKEPKETKQELEPTPQTTKKSEEKKNTNSIVITKKQEKLLRKGEPFKNSDTVKQFLQEVDKFEKYVESLNTKTLSGPSNLDLKWKEIQDSQENLDPAKKSISVARCYPLKNRSPDILPYDYSRVELKMARDDYINASHMKDVSPFCMDFIVTQTPISSTVLDFWTMIWEQQIETIVCLLSNNELKEEIYWPTEVGKELMIQTNIVTMLSCTEKEFWTERKINYAHLEMKESRLITLLQFTSWPGSLFPTNPLPFVDFIKRVITTYDQQKCNGNPVLVHCVAGVGRSGIATVLLATLMELAAVGVPLPDIPSLACKMSNARKNILRDREHLKFVYTALLSYLQTLKREFTKSDSDKSEDTNIVPIEKVAVDPLSTLDPLWATRK